MQRHHGVGVDAGLDDGVPVVALPQVGEPDHVGPFGHRDAGEPALGVAVDLGDRGVGVAQERDAERDDAGGMRGVPLLEQPVVPGSDARLPELGVLCVEEDAAAEPGDHRREVHRRPHAVEVHVAHAGVDVVATRSHLVEAERFLLLGGLPPGDRVHPDLRELLLLELPDLQTLGSVGDARRPVLEVLRQATLEGVRGFDDVVVDRDHGVLHVAGEWLRQKQVLGLFHHTYSQRCSGSGPPVRSMHCTSNQIGSRYFT